MRVRPNKRGAQGRYNVGIFHRNQSVCQDTSRTFRSSRNAENGLLLERQLWSATFSGAPLIDCRKASCRKGSLSAPVLYSAPVNSARRFPFADRTGTEFLQASSPVVARDPSSLGPRIADGGQEVVEQGQALSAFWRQVTFKRRND